jgi:hypothetical protein
MTQAASNVGMHATREKREYPIFLAYPHKGKYISLDRDNNVREIVYLLRCP